MTEPHKPAAALNDLPLAELDPDIAEVLAGELARQRDSLDRKSVV